MALFYNSFHQLLRFWLLSSPVSESLSLRSVQRYVWTRNSLPFHVCALFFSVLSTLSASLFVSPLYVSTIQVPLAQTWGSCWLCFFVTLYSWTTPFCSSSGGGCQETTMAVPLSPLSITVTLRGGALGAEGDRQKIKNTPFYMRLIFFFQNGMQSLPVSPHLI